MMTTRAELHVQAAVWTNHDWRYAVLLMEGESPDRTNDGRPLLDALQAVALARGLHMTTDPDQLPLRVVPGWRVGVSETSAITVHWPHGTPLLANVSVALPDGWLDAARETGTVLVFAGHGLGLHEHARDGQAHASALLRQAATDGGAGGAVAFEGHEEAAARLDGTVTRPRRGARHRPTTARVAIADRTQRWWSRRIHGNHRI